MSAAVHVRREPKIELFLNLDDEKPVGEEINLGEILEGDVKEAVIWVKNIGAGTAYNLRVGIVNEDEKDFVEQYPGLEVICKSTALRPREAAFITIKWDTKNIESDLMTKIGVKCKYYPFSDPIEGTE